MAPATINNYPWFEDLVYALRKEGYKCETTNGKKKVNVMHANTCMVTGKNIRACFTRPEPAPEYEPYTSLQECIAADHAKCFDKWQKCPLVIKLPSNIENILAHLAHLGSEEGYEISNKYQYLDTNPWPYHTNC